MHKILSSFFLVAALAFGAPTVADDQPVLVELFTSQGCSSCPPADALLHELAKRDDVVALALHVDYWDYIGWKDEFANPAHSARQRAYVRGFGTRPYTPQMIIGGRDHIAGARPMKLMDMVAAQHASADTVLIRLVRRGDQLTIKAAKMPGLSKPVQVQLVRFDPLRSVNITRGENRGRNLDYANVVTSWETIGQWTGREPLVMSLTVKGNDGVVVIIQHRGPGPVVAVAQLR